MSSRSTVDLEFFQQEDGPGIIVLGRNFGQPILLNPDGIAINRYFECLRLRIADVGPDSSGRSQRYTIYFEDPSHQWHGKLERDASKLIWQNTVFTRIPAPSRIKVVSISELQKVDPPSDMAKQDS